MKTFEIEVRQTVKVTLDESKFTEPFMEEFRAHFFPFYDVEDHAKHIAQLTAREVADFGHNRHEFVEGYGPIGDFGIRAEVTDTEMEVL
ncbi:hypothetical protein [Pseudaminobacter soli (ex Zhang et al. 2022)]|uniref:hypothetical protein n=1 Tax=Pseudaminobacter soli (ex Zhang et al. 2022) TaxID=2831468 RepID=UPI001AED7CBE|nr:hypothetical protein [Pseudaminobacter soli]